MYNLTTSNSGLVYYSPNHPILPANCKQDVCSYQQCYRLLKSAMTNKPAVCRICEKHFSNTTNFMRHFRMHLNEPILYECDECPQIFNHKESMESHLISHAEEPLKLNPLVCELCGAQFNVWIEFMEHKALHSDVRAFYCDECDKRFPFRYLFKAHLILHTGHKPYDCDKCRSLKSNMAVHCEQRFKCEHCDKEFCCKTDLSIHLDLHSNVIKRFKCDQCERSFVSKSKLEAHLMVHSTVQYKCSQCFKKFKYITSFTRHIAIRKGRKVPFQCEICDKRFYFQCEFKTHSLTHSQTVPENKIKNCDYCHKKFNNESRLKIHLRTHTGERPFKCEQCPKSFRRKEPLKIHYRTHTHPYRCDLCGVIFLRDQSLQAHRARYGVSPGIQSDVYKCHQCSKCFHTKICLKGHIRKHHKKPPTLANIEQTLKSVNEQEFELESWIKIEPEEFREDDSIPQKSFFGNEDPLLDVKKEEVT